jgi:hypothetical protein
MPRPLAVLAFLLAAAVASALEWKTQHLAIKTGPLQKTTEAAFEFTNNSDRTVTITSVDSSCDCLDAVPSAKTFAPGASGRIQARFTVGDRSGIYRRTILVATDEGTVPAALTVELDVAEVATLSPRSLEWKLHADPVEQAVDVMVNSSLEITITKVQGTSDAFAHRLETVQAGRHYRLHLAPRTTRDPANAAFRLYAKASTGEDLVLSVYGNVR